MYQQSFFFLKNPFLTRQNLTLSLSAITSETIFSVSKQPCPSPTPITSMLKFSTTSLICLFILNEFSPPRKTLKHFNGFPCTSMTAHLQPFLKPGSIARIFFDLRGLWSNKARKLQPKTLQASSSAAFLRRLLIRRSSTVNLL